MDPEGEGCRSTNIKNGGPRCKKEIMREKANGAEADTPGAETQEFIIVKVLFDPGDSCMSVSKSLRVDGNAPLHLVLELFKSKVKVQSDYLHLRISEGGSLDLDDPVKLKLRSGSAVEAFFKEGTPFYELGKFPSSETAAMIMTLPDLELADEDENGHTFVHHLCMGPMAERNIGAVEDMLSKLVKRKIVIEKPDKAGVTPSMICLRTNKFDVFQIFSKWDVVNLDHMTADKSTFLHVLASQKRPDTVEALQAQLSLVRILCQRGSLFYARTAEGMSAVHLAAAHGNKEILSLFMENIDRSSVDDVTLTGMTPLHLAVSNRNLDTIAMLLFFGADVQLMSPSGLAIDLLGDTPEDMQIRQVLLAGSMGAVPHEWLMHIKGDNADALGALISQAREEHSRSLHEEANPFPFVEAVNAAFLISCSYAALYCASAIMKEKAFNPHFADQEGRTALQILSRNMLAHDMYIPLFSMLLKVANVNMRGRQGNSAYHSAALGNNQFALRMLRRHGANINTLNDNHETELHLAVRSGQQSLIMLLMASGCDASIVSRENLTAGQLAERRGRKDLADLITSFSGDGKTADSPCELHSSVVIMNTVQVSLLEITLLDAGAVTRAQDELELEVKKKRRGKMRSRGWDWEEDDDDGSDQDSHSMKSALRKNDVEEHEHVNLWRTFKSKKAFLAHVDWRRLAVSDGWTELAVFYKQDVATPISPSPRQYIAKSQFLSCLVSGSTSVEEAQLLLFTHPCIVPTDILTHSFFANLHLQLKEQDKQVLTVQIKQSLNMLLLWATQHTVEDFTTLRAARSLEKLVSKLTSKVREKDTISLYTKILDCLDEDAKLQQMVRGVEAESTLCKKESATTQSALLAEVDLILLAKHFAMVALWHLLKCRKELRSAAGGMSSSRYCALPSLEELAEVEVDAREDEKAEAEEDVKLWSSGTLSSSSAVSNSDALSNSGKLSSSGTLSSAPSFKRAPRIGKMLASSSKSLSGLKQTNVSLGSFADDGTRQLRGADPVEVQQLAAYERAVKQWGCALLKMPETQSGTTAIAVRTLIESLKNECHSLGDYCTGNALAAAIESARNTDFDDDVREGKEHFNKKMKKGFEAGECMLPPSSYLRRFYMELRVLPPLFTKTSPDSSEQSEGTSEEEQGEVLDMQACAARMASYLSLTKVLSSKVWSHFMPAAASSDCCRILSTVRQMQTGVYSLSYASEGSPFGSASESPSTSSCSRNSRGSGNSTQPTFEAATVSELSTLSRSSTVSGVNVKKQNRLSTGSKSFPAKMSKGVGNVTRNVTLSSGLTQSALGMSNTSHPTETTSQEQETRQHFSYPTCIMHHHMERRVNRRPWLRHPVTQQTVGARLIVEWGKEDSEVFVFRRGGRFHRELRIEVVRTGSGGGIDSSSGALHLASGTLVLDHSLDGRLQEKRVTLNTPHGVIGTALFSLSFTELPASDLNRMYASNYQLFDPLLDVHSLKKNTGMKSVAAAKLALGMRPKYPVLIFPGLASSALECLQTPQKEWHRERVWIDPFKIGKLAAMQKISDKFNKRGKKHKRTKSGTYTGSELAGPEPETSSLGKELVLMCIMFCHSFYKEFKLLDKQADKSTLAPLKPLINELGKGKSVANCSGLTYRALLDLSRYSASEGSLNFPPLPESVRNHELMSILTSRLDGIAKSGKYARSTGLAQVPKGVDVGDWQQICLGVIYQLINHTYAFVGATCTESSCPVMNASPNIIYKWADGESQVVAISVSAREYVTCLNAWVVRKLGESFTGKGEVGGKKKENTLVSTITKKEVRVLGHLFHAHKKAYEGDDDRTPGSTLSVERGTTGNTSPRRHSTFYAGSTAASELLLPSAEALRSAATGSVVQGSMMRGLGRTSPPRTGSPPRLTVTLDGEGAAGSGSGTADAQDKYRTWIMHMLLEKDGYSDPPGIVVRPVQGLHGIDFLAESVVAKASSYVFGPVVKLLTELGYGLHNLDAAPYDWRLPPERLQSRDNFFGSVKSKIECFREFNNAKVVLLGHSMGNRCIQYFLRWIHCRNSDWIDENVESFFAMGPPFLGSPKALRTVLTGDSMGLDVLLTNEESLVMAQNSSSLPWLYPVKEDAYPDDFIRFNASQSWTLFPSHSQARESRARDEAYIEQPFRDMLRVFCKRQEVYFRKFYEDNDMYLRVGGAELEVDENGSNLEQPVLQPPPVKKVWVLNGINRATEVAYFYKNTGDDRRPKLQLDTYADKYSKKCSSLNPRGLVVEGGIAFETQNTYQPSCHTHKSGDGTVPYCSLNYAEQWAPRTPHQTNRPHVYTIEVEDAEHREMLSNEAIHSAIADLLCERVPDTSSGGSRPSAGNGDVGDEESAGSNTSRREKKKASKTRRQSFQVNFSKTTSKAQ